MHFEGGGGKSVAIPFPNMSQLERIISENCKTHHSQEIGMELEA